MYPDNTGVTRGTGNQEEEDVPFSAFLLSSAKVLWEYMFYSCKK